MLKKNVVRLTAKDRRYLQGLLRRGRDSTRKLTRARILLKADVRGPAWSDAKIAQALEVGLATVERVRRRFAAGGVPAAVERRPQPARPEKRKLDGVAEAKLIALACSQPPESRERWTLDLLADHMVRLNYVESVSRYTVGRTLKKTNSSHG